MKTSLAFAAGIGLQMVIAAVACGGEVTGDDDGASSGEWADACAGDSRGVARCGGSSGSPPVDGSSSGQASSSSSSSGDLPDSGGRVPLKHRASATPCDNVRPDDEPSDIPDTDAGDYVQCRTNAECTEGVNGRCRGNGHDGWRCTYDSCTTDDQCGAGKVCECEGGFRTDSNVCMNVGCQIDADCGAGGYCSPSLGSCGNYGGVVTYQCHTPQDECIDDGDCSEGTCRHDPALGRWACSTSECAG